MKAQPFSLKLWHILGKPNCIWTRGKDKVIEFYVYNSVDNLSTGIVCKKSGKFPFIWRENGALYSLGINDIFSEHDLMLHIDEAAFNLARHKVFKKNLKGF